MTFDLEMPLGVAGGVPYVALVLIGAWLPNRRSVYFLAIVASALTIIGVLVSPPGGVPWIVLTNRGLALFAIWAIAVLIAIRKTTEGQLLKSNNQLEKQTTQLSQEIEQRKQTTRALAQSENSLRMILESAADAIITMDDQGNVDSFNKAAETTFDRPSEEIIGLSINTLIRHCDSPSHDHPKQTLMKAQLKTETGNKSTWEGRKRDGSYFPISLAVSEANNDGIISYMAIVRDISAEQEAATQVVAARDEARNANKAKSDFLSSMSHELRTPLNAILGFSQLLKFNTRQSAEHIEYLNLIVSSGNHLLELVNQVLELSRIESGNLSVSLKEVDIVQTLQETIDLVSSDSPMQKMKISTELVCNDKTSKPSDYMIVTDPLRLRQIMFNLLSNAFKYNRPDGKIVVSYRKRSDGRLRIAVTDTGIGIPKDQQDNLFPPFERLGKEFGDIEGTGIGLSITQHIVKILGGEMNFESEPGKGSKFWFDLPTQRLADKDTDAEQSTSYTSMTQPFAEYVQDPRLILYIEDNQPSVSLMNGVIKHVEGALLVTAASAEVGLSLIENSPIDLVLMDINLPGMNGYDALQKIRAFKDQDKLPVIAISADAMPSDIERGLKAGFNDYIAKPIEIVTLMKSIEEAVRPSGSPNKAA